MWRIDMLVSLITRKVAMNIVAKINVKSVLIKSPFGTNGKLRCLLYFLVINERFIGKEEVCLVHHPFEIVYISIDKVLDSNSSIFIFSKINHRIKFEWNFLIHKTSKIVITQKSDNYQKIIKKKGHCWPINKLGAQGNSYALHNYQ